MTVQVAAFDLTQAAVWDEFCARAVNATFLHTRRFLSYHGDRFLDRSVTISHDGELVGVMSAAQAPDDPATVVSHPGATYGGLVHTGWLTGERTMAAVEAVASHYRDLGYQRLLYKAVPHIYALAPAQDDLYALFRYGATRVRTDLSSTIDLAARRPISDRRKRGLKKATKSVSLDHGHEHLAALWHVLADNLARKHDAKPVHSIDELNLLAQRFPDAIRSISALLDGQVVAGTVLFNSARVWHAQYIAASEAGYGVSALDAVFEEAIVEASRAGARYFDFGVSTEDNGLLLNEGLYRFKSEFGGGGTVHEFYELNLRQG